MLTEDTSSAHSAALRPSESGTEVVTEAPYAYAECAICGRDDMLIPPSAHMRSLKSQAYWHARRFAHTVRVVTTKTTTYRG